MCINVLHKSKRIFIDNNIVIQIDYTLSVFGRVRLVVRTILQYVLAHVQCASLVSAKTYQCVIHMKRALCSHHTKHSSIGLE